MSSPITSPQSTEDPTQRVRLHITPFNPTLLPKILPPPLQAQATNISFHTVETYPERGFGYVELPSMEAQKLKKKIHGSTLKGTKMRVEDAKPERKRKSEESTTEEDEGRKLRKLERRARRKGGEEQGVIAGHELEEGRRVKRGWKNEETEGRKGSRKGKAGKDAQEGEQGVEGKKLRFKTSVPTTPVEPESKAKKGKDSRGGQKKVVVEEFAKRKKPAISSSDRGAPGPGALSFEEGIGWVDDAGNVVDALPKALQRDPIDSGHDSERRISAIESTEPPAEQAQDNSNDAMSVDDPVDTIPTPIVDAQLEEAQETAAAKEVHPLEALFKRPAKAVSPPPATSSRSSSRARKAPPGPINTSFSFFPSGDTEEGDEEATGSMAPPQTPHTKRDMEWRSIRSAAPTPDTAAIGRRFSFGLGGGRSSDEDEDDDEDNDTGDQGHDTPMQGAENVEDVDATVGAAQQAEDGQANGRGEESAFRKWFYENRGDLNRSWKKRRRDEKKILRQRENRRVGARVA